MNQDQVQSVTRLDRTDPASDRELVQPCRELAAEAPADLAQRCLLVLTRQQKRISQNGEIHVRSRGLEPCQECLGIAVGRFPPAIPVEVDVIEGQAGFHAKLRGVLGQVVLELLLGGVQRSDEILRKELQLLPQAPSHDGVVAIEPQGQGLTVEDLFADEVLDQAVQLLHRRRPLPRTRPALDQPLDLPGRDDDLVGGSLVGVPHEAEQHEQPRAQDQEMKQWLPEQPHPSPTLRGCTRSARYRRAPS